jgi:hypothetical protein
MFHSCAVNGSIKICSLSSFFCTTSDLFVSNSCFLVLGFIAKVTHHILTPFDKFMIVCNPPIWSIVFSCFRTARPRSVRSSEERNLSCVVAPISRFSSPQLPFHHTRTQNESSAKSICFLPWIRDMSHISAVETAMKLTARKPAYEIEWVVEGDIKRTANSRQGDDGFECLVR